MADRKTYPEIGARLRRLRATYGPEESATSWAAIHGFNRPQYAHWETGARRIPLEAAEKLADLYGLSLDWFYRGRWSGLTQDAADRLCNA